MGQYLGVKSTGFEWQYYAFEAQTILMLEGQRVCVGTHQEVGELYKEPLIMQASEEEVVGSCIFVETINDGQESFIDVCPKQNNEILTCSSTTKYVNIVLSKQCNK